MQTAGTGEFPTSFGKGFGQIYGNEGINGLYKGLAPLWMRQVPYTMVKFAAFENTVKAFYKYIFTQPKDTYSKSF